MDIIGVDLHKRESQLHFPRGRYDRGTTISVKMRVCLNLRKKCPTDDIEAMRPCAEMFRNK